MKINEITLHNFRSIKDGKVSLADYSLLIGANNSGKTGVIDAIRIFYEASIKFDLERDFPKFKTEDNESWVEIEYLLSKEETDGLKEEYRIAPNKFKVRKYFKSVDSDLVKSNQSNIYAYENGLLSKNLFYGAKNISQAKLGEVIHIPAVSSIDEQTKMSGPSTLRNVLDFVMKKVVKNSSAYEKLQKSFEEFNEVFQKETSDDGVSLNKLKEDINAEISGWGASIGIDINPVDPALIIKSLVSHHINESSLEGHKMNMANFGQGFQRYMIYTLLKISTKYRDKSKASSKKDFLPQFTFLLFDEPEAFLHPTQQEILNLSLEEISKDQEQQVLISTHSPSFVSKNIENIRSLTRLNKIGAETRFYQINNDKLSEVLMQNIEDLRVLMGESLQENDLELESLRYSCWLDSARSSAFFANFVLLCEGASEKVLIEYLIKTGKIEVTNKEIYVLDAMGKYNLHRYMNLFSLMGVQHSVLFDSDNNSERNKKINDFLKNNKNSFTKEIHSFDKELEDFLGIPKCADKHRKPIEVLWNYKNGKIEESKLTALKEIILKLIR